MIFLEPLARWQYGVYVEGGLINVREMKWIPVRWHSFPANFTTKKKQFNLCYPQKGKKKKEKIVGEENGLDPERVHARHLDLRLTRLSNAPL